MTSEDGRDLKAFERYHRTSSESSERKKTNVHEMLFKERAAQTRNRRPE